MIISASYKTDIPAFYGKWLLNRLDAGYCMVINPYNKQAQRVSLRHEDVDGFVFWTKNLTPFIHNLQTIKEQGYAFIVQYSINNYPRTLEISVVNAEQSINHMRVLSDTYGQRALVWRYDPIVFTSITPFDFHISSFKELAKNLEGTTDEVVVSFAQIYKKTQRNMNWASETFGFTWSDPPDEVKIRLVLELNRIAKSHKMQLSICSQKQYLIDGIVPARCIDARRLSEVSGKLTNVKVKGNRPDCECYLAKDIGDYDTCPHGCVYCYAVNSRALAQKLFREHNPQGEFLHTPQDFVTSNTDTNDDTQQMKLL